MEQLLSHRSKEVRETVKVVFQMLGMKEPAKSKGKAKGKSKAKSQSKGKSSSKTKHLKK